MTIANYGTSVYNSFRLNIKNMRITGYTLLLTVKQGICKPFDYKNDLLAFIRNPDDTVATIGLEILCRFKSKHAELTKIHFDLFIEFLEGSTWFNDARSTVNTLRLFHSHLIVTTNFMLNRDCEMTNLHLIIQYLDFLYYFCLVQMGTKCHIRNEFGFKVYQQICELFMSDSSKLLVNYNLNEADRYAERKCKVYTILLKTREWKYTSKTAWKTLICLCENNNSVPVGLISLTSFFDLNADDILCLQTRALQNENYMNPLDISAAAMLYIVSIQNKILSEEDICKSIAQVVALLKERFTKIKENGFPNSISKHSIHPLLKIIILSLEFNIFLDAKLNSRSVFTLCRDIIYFIMMNKESVVLLDTPRVQKTVEAVLIVRVAFVNFFALTIFSCRSL